MAIKAFGLADRIAAALVAAALAVGCAQARELASNGGPSLRDLAPVRLYPVPVLPVEQPRELPPPGEAEPAPPDAAAQETGGQSMVGLQESWHAPDFSSGGWRPMGTDLLAEGAWAPDRSIVDNWTLGTRNWRYTRPNGVGLTVGNDVAAAPGWGNAARMGGVRLTKALTSGNAAAGQWQYSAMVGALDYSPGSATEGGLIYGPGAGNTVVRYGWTSTLTLESQLEWAPDMKNVGLGGQYNMQRWGVWKAGVAKAAQDLHEGMRYQFGYENSILDTLKLSWVNEQRTGGFSDLNRYRDFSVDQGLTRNLFTATLPLGRWGDLSGSYETVDTPAGPSREYIGLAQQFWLSPKLQVSFKADRDRLSGDYDVGLRFSIPLD